MWPLCHIHRADLPKQGTETCCPHDTSRPNMRQTLHRTQMHLLFYFKYPIDRFCNLIWIRTREKNWKILRQEIIPRQGRESNGRIVAETEYSSAELPPLRKGSEALSISDDVFVPWLEKGNSDSHQNTSSNTHSETLVRSQHQKENADIQSQPQTPSR